MLWCQGAIEEGTMASQMIASEYGEEEEEEELLREIVDGKTAVM